MSLQINSGVQQYKIKNKLKNPSLSFVQAQLSAALALIASGAVGSSGCFSMQNQTTIDGIQEATAKLPIVEAVIEYPGPQDRWAGPVTFTMQIIAKDAGPATIRVSPALFQTPGVRMKEPDVESRVPASQGTKGLSGEAARDRLAHLAASLSGAEESFRGCLYPIRIRFVRADGSLSEKKGCRGQSSWSGSVSKAVNDFIVSSLGGSVAMSVGRNSGSSTGESREHGAGDAHGHGQAPPQPHDPGHG